MLETNGLVKNFYNLRTDTGMSITFKTEQSMQFNLHFLQFGEHF